MRVACLGVLALLLLAGCSSGAGKDPGTDFGRFKIPPPTDTTGLIRGIVVDGAIQPVPQATVTLATQPPQSVQTAEDGAFGFGGLPPGTYFLSVRKAGYTQVQQSADVAAGVAEPPILKVQVQLDASFVQPYAESFTFEGFLECSAGFVDTLGDYGVENACSEDVAGTRPFPNDSTVAVHQPSGAADWVQSEMVWQSTQAVSHSMTLSFAIPSDDTVSHPDGWDDLSVFGPSPLVDAMDAQAAAKYMADGTLTLRVFPWADQEPGVIVAVEQKFTVYTTVFHGYTPPAGWLFSVDGSVPAPPA